MKTLILHLGLQKTGSTSVQETLLHNPAVLEAAGYRYGHILWPDGGLNSNHSFPLIVAFSDGWQNNGEIRRRGWSPEGLKEHFTAQIDAALSLDSNLILSGEDITDIGPEGLAALAARIEARGFRIKPVMLVRSPLEFITSMSQTRIRHGYGYHIFAAAKSKRIAPCLKLWPDMACVPFAEAVAHPDGPTGKFLESCGLPGASKFNLIRKNESMTEFATRIIGHINTDVPLYLDGQLNPKRRYLDTEPLATLPGPKYVLTTAEFNTIRGAVVAENAAMADLLGPRFCDQQFRFNGMPTPWTAQALAALAKAMAELDPVLQDSIRRYFTQSPQVSDEERRLAAVLDKA